MDIVGEHMVSRGEREGGRRLEERRKKRVCVKKKKKKKKKEKSKIENQKIKRKRG